MTGCVQLLVDGLVLELYLKIVGIRSPIAGRLTLSVVFLKWWIRDSVPSLVLSALLVLFRGP